VHSASETEQHMTVKRYDELIAWQKAMDLVEGVYTSTTMNS
jgi:hypothetical protein